MFSLVISLMCFIRYLERCMSKTPDLDLRKPDDVSGNYYKFNKTRNIYVYLITYIIFSNEINPSNLFKTKMFLIDF